MTEWWGKDKASGPNQFWEGDKTAVLDEPVPRTTNDELKDPNEIKKRAKEVLDTAVEMELPVSTIEENYDIFDPDEPIISTEEKGDEYSYSPFDMSKEGLAKLREEAKRLRAEGIDDVRAINQYFDISEKESLLYSLSVIPDPDEPTGFGREPALETTYKEKTRALADEDLEYLIQTATNYPKDVSDEIRGAVFEEKRIRDTVKIIKSIPNGWQSAYVILQRRTNLFNLPSYVSRKGLEKIWGGAGGEAYIAKEAAERVLQEKNREDAFNWTRVLDLPAGIGQVLVEFAALPDITSKIAVFSRLPVAAQSIVATSTRFAMREAVTFPEEGETVTGKLGKVGISATIGAGLGATGRYIPNPFIRIPTVTGGFMGLTALEGGTPDQILEAGVTILGFETLGLIQRGNISLRTRLGRRRMTRAIKAAKKHNPDLKNIPDDSIGFVLKEFKNISFWQKELKKGRVTQDVAHKRIYESLDKIEPVARAIHKETAAKKADQKSLRKALKEGIPGISPKAAKRAVDIAAKEGVEKADKYLTATQAVGEKQAEVVMAAQPPTRGVQEPTEAVAGRKEEITPVTVTKPEAAKVAPEALNVVETKAFESDAGKIAIQIIDKGDGTFTIGTRGQVFGRPYDTVHSAKTLERAKEIAEMQADKFRSLGPAKEVKPTEIQPEAVGRTKLLTEDEVHSIMSESLDKNEYTMYLQDEVQARTTGDQEAATRAFDKEAQVMFERGYLYNEKRNQWARVSAEFKAEVEKAKAKPEAVEVAPEAKVEIKHTPLDTGEGLPLDYLTATADGKEVGTLRFEEEEDEIIVMNIDVAESQRRKGIGTALVNKLRSMFPNKEIKTDLLTDEGQKFFAKLAQPPTEAKAEAVTFKEGKSEKGRPTLTAMREGKSVGKVIYEQTDEGIRIQNIDVVEEHRREGIGTALIEQIKEKFPDQKIDYTMPAGKEAKAFLEKVTEAKPKGKMPEIASGGLPIEPPGLTKAEAEHLGVGPKAALRAGQKRGLSIGYKKGYQEAALEGRRKLSYLRIDKIFSQKNREFVREVIQKFVPKEEQYRFMVRLTRVKDAKSVEKLTGEIEKYIDDYEHRGAVREFKKFVNETNKKFKRGEVKLGELSKTARDKLGQAFSEYDAVKLSEEKAEDLQKHKEHIQKVAGSISSALREWENLDEQGLDIVRLPNRRVQDLERLEKTPIKELGTEEIQYIQDELNSLLSRETRKRKIRNRIKSEYAHTYVTQASNEVADRGITKRGEAKAPGVVKRFFGTSQSNLRSLVRSATTKDAKATEEFLVDRIYDSLRDSDRLHKEWFLYARGLFEKAGIKEQTINDLYSDISLTLGGKKYTVPKWTLLNLWLNAEADGNLRRLLLAREHQLTRKGKTAYIGKIRLEELQNAVEQMPKEYKKIAEIIFKVNREKNAPAINETSIWERGYPIAVYEKYFPFPRKMRNVPEGHRTEIQLALESRGRYQKRTGGNLPHVMKDPLIEFINGLQLDAQYHSMALPLQDAKALLADNKWRTRMDKAGNKPIVDTIIKMYQRGEGLSTDRNIADVLAGRYLATMGKGTLSMRPSGGFIQTASKSAAYSIIAGRYFNQSYIPKPSDAKALMDLDATMWWRWEARRFDYVLGSQSGENSVRKLITGKDPIRDGLVRHYTWGDQWAVLKIWNAAQNQIESTTDLKRDSKAFTDESLKLFHRAMETQPQWDIWHRSIFTSEPRALERSFAMFMSARNAQYNVLLQAKDDYVKGRIDKRTMGNRIGDIVEANLRVSIYRRLFRKIIKYGTLGVLFGVGKRDEEDIKAHVEKDLALEVRKVPMETIFNLIGLPVYGQIIATTADEIIKGFEGKWSKVKFGDVRTGSVLVDFIVDLGLAGHSMGSFGRDLALQTEYVSGPKEGELKWKDSGLEVVNDISEIVSQLTGIGYSGPRSDIVWPAESAFKLEPIREYELKLEGMTREELEEEFRKTHRMKPSPMEEVREKLREGMPKGLLIKSRWEPREDMKEKAKAVEEALK